MRTVLWRRLQTRLFGEGLGATVAIGLAGWAWKKIRSTIGSGPELVDVSDLRPGESYVLTVRPPASKRERRAQAERDKLSRKVRKPDSPRRADVARLARIAELDAQLAEYRAGALKEAQQRARPPRQRIW